MAIYSRSSARIRSILLTLAFGAVLGSAYFFTAGRFHRETEAPNTTVVQKGRRIYATHCASCHGKNMQGQPNWKEPLADGKMPAPPHDGSGHTWHHSDDLLFRIVKYGSSAVIGGGYESDMPGFADALTDEEIRAVLQFIKSRWSERQKAYQAQASGRQR